MEEVSGNIFMRKWRGLKKGHVIQGHKHNWDHTTIIFLGGIHIKAHGAHRQREKDFHAPDHVLILADVEHEITVLEDGTEFWCVYSHRNAQGEVVQQYTGWGPAYL